MNILNIYKFDLFLIANNILLYISEVIFRIINIFILLSKILSITNIYCAYFNEGLSKIPAEEFPTKAHELTSKIKIFLYLYF